MRKVLINGASGKMGQALIRLMKEHPSLNLSPDTLRDKHQMSGGDFDIVIDFSTPQGAEEAFELARENDKPFLTGTTNLSATFLHRLQQEKFIPVFYAPNVSLSVYLFTQLAKQAARFYNGYDVSLHEIHHVHKKDAPSGTAKNLAVVVHYPVEKVTYERIGETVGTHTLSFKTPFDEITLSHQALNRDLFAFSALQIAGWLLSCPAGFYTMEDYAIFKLKEK